MASFNFQKNLYDKEKSYEIPFVRHVLNPARPKLRSVN